MNLMNCGKDKATKAVPELDKEGIGLIERKKQGQGRFNRIYVKNFSLPRIRPAPAVGTDTVSGLPVPQ